MIKKTLDWQNKDIVEIYDEVPLWSAPFGNMLLTHIPMQANWTIVDLGFGTGFPLIELAQRFGESSKIIGVDIWEAAMDRVRKKKERLELTNIELVHKKASTVSLADDSIDLVCSNLGVNNFENRASVFQNVYRMLKKNGHFCFTTNDQNTFKELFVLFEKAFINLDINRCPLQKYIESRVNIKLLVEQLKKEGFRLNKQLENTSYLRFVSSKAIFNHSLIRIAFLSTWQNMVPKEKWSSFIDMVSSYIDELIAGKGEFRMTIPMVYLDFIK